MSRVVTGGWVLLAALGVMLAGAPASKATSGGCFIPTFAVVVFEDDFFGGLGELSPEEKTCKKQCKDFEGGCKGVVSAANSCVKDAIGALLDAEKAACDDLEGDEKKLCQDGVKSDQDDLKEELKQDQKDAKDDCKTGGDDCETSCSGV